MASEKATASPELPDKAECERIIAEDDRWRRDMHERLGASFLDTHPSVAAKMARAVNEQRESIERQAVEIKRLTAENFALASHQCTQGHGDEGGSWHCCCEEVEGLKAEIESCRRETNISRAAFAIEEGEDTYFNFDGDECPTSLPDGSLNEDGLTEEEIAAKQTPGAPNAD